MQVNYTPGTFARFFRAVEGRSVSRYGTARGGKNGYRAATIIGGHRPPLTPAQQRARGHDMRAPGCNPVVWDTSVVAAISPLEAQKYRREYNRAVKDESLVEVTENDYIAFLRREAEKAVEAQERASVKKAARKAALERESALAAEQAQARQLKNGTGAAAASHVDASGSGGPD